MLKKFFTGYLVGLILFGAIIFGVSSKLAPSDKFRPLPIELEAVNIEEITP